MGKAMRGDQQPARGFARRLGWGVARCLALVLLAPAIYYNIDWHGHGSWGANATAVIMVLASALFIEGAWRLRNWVLTPLCVLAAAFLVYGNTKQALRNQSFNSEAASEAKSADLASASHLASQRSHLLTRRKVQVELAGETAVGALEAQLKALQLSDLKTWNDTSQCEDVTARRSGRFCIQVEAARAKIDAAKERDKIDADLAKLPAPKMVVAPNTEAPVADAYVANVKVLANEMGFNPSERLIRAEEALSRAAGYEVVAALGPTCWLAFINMLAAGAGAAGRRSPPKPAPKPLPASGEKVPATLPDGADDLDRCIADIFEPDPAGVMTAKDIRPLAEAWFEKHGEKVSEKLLWPRMRQRFKHDANNGRPRYLGLRPRAKGPPRLAVVAGRDS